MVIKPNDRVVFFGDSITDCGRDRDQPHALGQGYVFLINAWLKYEMVAPELLIFNRGISGNRIYDLEARLDEDVLALDPSVVTILIGINDTWRRFDSGIGSPIEQFHASYHRILSRLREELNPEIILMEPFLLPVPDDRRLWREDLDPRIGVVRELAVEFETSLVPLDSQFAVASTWVQPDYWLPDGVHPSPAGHALISRHWLDLVEY
ncbi:MAG: GDSL family lipase [Puniceicoccaceae bacterium]|nr:MAG: GDSL family lipase [Puniceicoccaceae bacterium]